MANASPAGVRVAVGGTGMSAVVGADGRFAFAGVAEGVDLIFQRQSDGVNARLSLASTSAPVVVELSQSAATLSSHRRASPSVPQEQIEGLITAAGTTSITVHDSHGNDDVLQITDKTIIRKGHTTLTAADLKTGWRVHVMATDTANNTKTAVLILVQDDSSENDDHGNVGQIMTANGTIKSIGTNSFVVTTVPKGDVTVNVDSNTIIRKQGAVVTLADLKVGDQVNTMGTRVDDHTLLARQIEVRGVGQNERQEMSAEGTVKSVGSDNLVVTTHNSGDITVKVDGSTVIRKEGSTIQLADVKGGDSVSAEGTRVDDHTLLARQIEVHGGSGHH